jgi:hypothetical protein
MKNQINAGAALLALCIPVGGAEGGSSFKGWVSSGGNIHPHIFPVEPV